MLLEIQEPELKSPESEAFAATIDNFKIPLYDVARLSGVSQERLTRFYKGDANFTTRTLTRILLAFTPTQTAFFSALVQLQTAARAARVNLPLIKYREIADITDVYRQAFEYTLDAFNLEIVKVAQRSDIRDSNINAWKSGRRDLTQESFDKLKMALTNEQRTVFLALSEVLFIVAAEKMQKIRPSN